MYRAWIYSFAGAGFGFLIGVVIVLIMTATQPGDKTPVFLVVGVFLFGAGAVAGAIIGGVADLVEFFKRREQAREAHVQRQPESEV